MEKNNFKSRKKHSGSKAINSDITAGLDECPKLTNDKKVLSKAIKVSSEWAKDAKWNLEMINPKGYLE